MNADPTPATGVPVVATSAKKQPPLPRVALRVGILGGRELGLADDSGERMKECLTGIFALIACELHALKNSEEYYDKDQRPILRVVSGMADGADQIGARAALAASELANFQADLELAAILPFPRDQYRNTIHNQAEYDTLLGHELTKTLILDGTYEADDTSKPREHPENVLRQRRRHRAYRAQGWFLRQQSDLLIAVWDPMKEGRPGGTEDTLRRALHSGLPVAWIDPKQPDHHRLLSNPAELEVLLNNGEALALGSDCAPAGAPALKTLTGKPADAFDTELRERGIRQLLQVPKQGKFHTSGEKGGPVWRAASWTSAFLQGRSTEEGVDKPTDKEALREYFSSPYQVREGTFRGWLWSAIQFSILAVAAIFGEPGAWRELRESFKKKPRRSEEPKPWQLPYHVYREKAAHLARYYAGLYRGAFTLNYLLGALALLFAAGATVLAGQAWIFLVLACVLIVTMNTLYAKVATTEKDAATAEAGPVASQAGLPNPRNGPDHAANSFAFARTAKQVRTLLQRFRSTRIFLSAYGSLWRTLLNVVLIVAALATILDGTSGQAGESVLLLLVLLELACVGVILFNTWIANHRGFHKRSIIYRFLADALRYMPELARLSCSMPLSRLPAVHEPSNPRQSWMMWLYRATVRQAPALPRIDQNATKVFEVTDEHFRQSLELVQTSWLTGQARYHESNARQMGRASRLLELMSFALFLLAAAATASHAGHLYSELGSVEITRHEAHSNGTTDARREPAAGWSSLLSLTSIWLPALALFLTGLRTQAECRRLAERSQAMANRLRDVEDQRLKLLAQPSLVALGCPAWTTAIGVYELAQVLIDEVADWSVMYQMHEMGP